MLNMLQQNCNKPKKGTTFEGLVMGYKYGTSRPARLASETFSQVYRRLRGSFPNKLKQCMTSV